jgi:hypothetical protein
VVRNFRALIAALCLCWALGSSGAEGLARPSPETIHYGSACGVQRWAVKTLGDAEAAQLRPVAIPTSIATLSRLRPPADPSDLARRTAPVETTLWHVRVRLQGYSLEQDSDIHLLLRDPLGGQAMIGEIPAGFCSPEKYAAQYDAARREVERIGRHAAILERVWWLDYHGRQMPLVDVWGVGFWDSEHGQHGAAVNGVELHPVLRIALAQ